MPSIKSESEMTPIAASQILAALSGALARVGGNDRHLLKLISDPSLASEVADVLIGIPSSGGFALTIDYGQPLAAMVAAGHYDSYTPDITSETCPVGSGEESIDAILVHLNLNRNASDDEVTHAMERLGLRDCTMVEGLAFGAHYPELQRKFPIVFRGSVLYDPQDDSCVGCLWGDRRTRWLYLINLEYGWDPRTRFLAVRK